MRKWSQSEAGMNVWAVTCDFQQCGILTSVVSDESLQPLFKLRNSKCCSVSSLTVIEYSSDLQRLWSDCAYAQDDLRLCWSHIPHRWESQAAAHLMCCTEESQSLQWTVVVKMNGLVVEMQYLIRLLLTMTILMIGKESEASPVLPF